MLKHPHGRRVATAADYEKILRTAESLRHMTTQRGCTVDEAETAAKKLGQLIQRYDLIVRPPIAIPESAKKLVAIPATEAIVQTDRALLVMINGDEVWVPLSQIAKGSEVREPGDIGTLVVSEWWFGKQGWRHGW
jgi:hypothetical protein